MRSVEVTFPLSPRLCFVGTWREGNSGWAAAPDSTVHELNRRRVSFAHQSVYAHTEEGARSALRFLPPSGKDDSARTRPK